MMHTNTPQPYFQSLAEAGTNSLTPKGNRLSWPKYMCVNNLTKFAMRRQAVPPVFEPVMAAAETA